MIETKVIQVARRSRKDIAVRAAIAYYGFSSATKSFPKGVKVDVLEGKGKEELRGNAAKVATEVDKIWNENVGTLSRTARISNIDIKFYAKKLGLKATDKKVEEWMKAIADAIANVYLVTINHGKTKKMLLVNTNVTK
jgi:hypothetical protein